MTILYGSSDDLIEIEGYVSEQIECFFTAKDGIKFECEDSTKGTITFDGKLWKIVVTAQGSQFEGYRVSTGKPHDGMATGAYVNSDVLLLGDVAWIKVGGRKFRGG